MFKAIDINNELIFLFVGLRTFFCFLRNDKIYEVFFVEQAGRLGYKCEVIITFNISSIDYLHLAAKFVHFGFLKLLTVYFVDGMVFYSQAGRRVFVMALFLLYRKSFLRLKYACLYPFFRNVK